MTPLRTALVASIAAEDGRAVPYIPATRKKLGLFGSAIPHVGTDPLPAIPLITERPRRLIKRALKMPPCPTCGERIHYCDCQDGDE